MHGESGCTVVQAYLVNVKKNTYNVHSANTLAFNDGNLQDNAPYASGRQGLLADSMAEPRPSSNGYPDHNQTPSFWSKEQPTPPNGYVSHHGSIPSNTPDDRPRSSADEEVFFKQEKDWFVGGKYFQIQPRDQSEDNDRLYGAELILLRWKNDEGMALRVHTLEESRWSSGMSRTMVAVRPPRPPGEEGGKFKFPTIFLEENGPGDTLGAAVNRFARLDLLETGDFDRFRCKDLGILSVDTLALLRKQWHEYIGKALNL